MAALDNIASELLKSANEADLIYKKTRDQAQRDKAVRLRRIVENLKAISADGLTPTLDEVLTEGNTSTNTLNVGGITSDYLQLDTAATPTLAPGMFAWSDADGTANLRLKGNNVTLQLGQENVARVVNKTGSDLLESQYKVVRVRVASEGGSQGQRLAVVLAQGNNDPDSATTLGLVTENIANNQEGFITVFGNVNGINTTGSLQGETWVDGDVLYLSPTTAGSLTKVKPVAPQHTVIVGYVLYAHGVNGKIFVKVDNGYELDELHNVLITSPANNDLLQYNSTQQVWKNIPVATAVPTPTLAQVTTAGNTTSNTLIYTGTTEAIRPNVDSVGSLGASNFRYGILYSRAISAVGNSLDVAGSNINLNDTSGNVKLKVFGGTGNVTIQNGGTHVDAGYRLDVQGNTRVNGGNTSADIPFIINNRFQFKGDGALIYGNSAGHGRLTWDNSGAYFGGLSGYGVGIGANGALSHLFINTSGQVGIGTTSPGEKLQVAGNVHISGVGSALYFDTDASPKSIVQYVNNLYELHIYNGRGSTSRIIGGSGFVSLGSGTTQMLYLSTSSGNVGIGTTSPASKLTVLNTANTVAAIIGGGAAAPGWVGIGTVNSGALPFIQGYNNAVSGTTPLSLNPGGSNVLIGTATDSGYKLNVSGTAYVSGTAFIGGVATLNSDANIAGNVSTPQITARKYYQNPDGVPSNNLGNPTVTEMALFDEQFDNKTAFYPAVYGSSILTFETYNGTTWTDITSTLTDTQKKQLFGGDNSSSISIPYGTVQYQITINNPGPYVYLNALYAYWSGNGHSTQVHIWKKHNSGSWVQHTNSTTAVSSWPGHLYLPFSTIPWHPAGTLGTHYNQVRVVFTPAWNATFPTNNIGLYKTQWWGGYPASKRVPYTTNENRGVGFPADLTAAGALTSTGTFTANSTSTLAQLATFGNSAIFNNAAGTSGITFRHNGTNRGVLGIDATIYGVSTSNIGLYVYGANDLELSTNAIKRLIVKGGGNVLIGTTTDAGYRLDVNGTTRFTGNAYVASGELLLDNNQPMRWKDSGGNTRRSLLITAANDFQFGHVDSGWGGQTYLKAGRAITFVVNGSTGTSIFAGSFQSSGNFIVDTDTLVVDAANNRVGIGIASPTDKLHIVDSTNNNIFGRITATGTNASAAWVAMNNQNDNVVYRVFGDGVSGSQMGISLVRSASLMANLGGSGKFLLGTYSATDFVMGTGNAERMRLVDSTGNVLIGTTSDNGNKLQVAGTIDGQMFAANGINGWTGTIMIMTNPPGMQNIQVDGGIITNVF